MSSTRAKPAGMPACFAFTYTSKEYSRVSWAVAALAFCAEKDACTPMEPLHQFPADAPKFQPDCDAELDFEVSTLVILALKRMEHSSTCDKYHHNLLGLLPV